ncbi:TIGR03767 family metallophosphoesterase [Nitriliruptor alkaliphilus]|uniref:TIGR03767 family metallophosphoesterase n=1 Tax=Nitriliruptor alkaliphilus TaxID=427918 RepID=UPI000695AFD5|nr:TIGR03767 family metallophosphoesterase [Nitriliruptor alkaliphilus]
MDRRTFLARGGTVGAAAAAVTAFGSTGPWAAVARAQAEAAARTRGTVVSPAGTTLERTLVPGDGDGYVRFSEGPGQPVVVRDELAAPKAGREDRRAALATIVHLTDVHVIDGQSPTRVEFTDRFEDPAPAGNPGVFSSAWRPQETLTGYVADAMARQLRAIGVGPVTGRPFDAAVSTGDTTDNQQLNELEWALAVMDGGRPVAFNSGDPDRYEGVQDDDELSFDPAYYHPDTDRPDRYKVDLGYPFRPEMLELAVASFTAVGLPCPWYSVYGNHDGLLQGNLFDNPAFHTIATGPLKVVGLPDGLSPGALNRILTEGDAGRLLTLPHAPVREVTPDPDRRTITAAEWAAMHRADRGGPGPVGHGYSADAAESGELHYTFDISEDVLGIGLDTVNRTGYASGSIDRPQFAWLEQQLIAASSHYLTPDGSVVTTDNADRYLVLFAHHGTVSLDNPMPDIVHPTPGPRVLADELIALLHRFPNVIAFIVGHTHRNRITAHPPTGPDTGGFWELTTAAHVDHPQQARLVEVVDNHDGTLSLFGTIIDHAGPARAPEEARDVLDLAALSRELGLNDVQGRGKGAGGEDGDRNVELLITAPFTRTPDPVDPERPGRGRPDDVPPGPPEGRGETGGGGNGRGRGAPAATPAAADAGATQVAGVSAGAATTQLPATGGGAAAAGAALLAGAAALRRSGRDDEAVTAEP